MNKMQTSIESRKYSINCKGQLISFEQPKVMGILNLTPDSFFDGGKLKTDKELLSQASKFLKDGATFLDIGGVSTKPGAAEVNEQEELNRVIPAIEKILKEFPEALVSIDTFRASVAKSAVNCGASLINDISGGDFDELMFETVRELQVPYILMHIEGTPQTMQQNPTYKDVVGDVIFKLSQKVEKLRYLGVNDIIIDPGFGFGKTVEHNYQLLKNLLEFQLLNAPVLVGVSRKSMINKVLHTKPETALNGTTALNTLAIINGASILRVHDVKEASEVVKIVDQYQKV
ncbi:MAG: dihydropteroate synthase [Flavobacteriia bacterium]|nr:dihydropteroate synthase [Flavobacteriia bacterium]